MPTYEYECPECSSRFEKFQAISDAPVTMCDSCGAGNVKRLIGGGLGVIFKGSGFYSTDSRSSGSASAPKTTNDAGDKGGDSSSSKSESSKGDSGSGDSSSNSGGDTKQSA